MMVNKSFRENVFPDILKIARVKPIHKSESLHDPKNYRSKNTVNKITGVPTLTQLFQCNSELFFGKENYTNRCCEIS